MAEEPSLFGTAVQHGPELARESGRKSRRPKYQRRLQHCCTYAEIITTAIKASPAGKLTLREIVSYMSSNYECFRGTYVGWKNSVRHNLSASDSFVKVLRDSNKPRGKDNYWALKAANAGPAEQQSHQLCDSTETGVAESSPPTKTSPPAGIEPTTGAKKPGISSEKQSDPFRSSPSSSPCSSSSDLSRPAEVNRKDGSPPPDPCSLKPFQVAPSTGDEWDLLSDLFVPEDDANLPLYYEWLARKHSEETRRNPKVPDSGQYRRARATPSRETPISRASESTGVYTPRGVHDTWKRAALLPATKSESTTTVRGCSHPYGGRSYTGRHDVGLVNYSGPGPEYRYHPHHRRRRHNNADWQRGDDATARNVPNSLENSSVFVSAIRSSLGLEMDEMALYAIEGSVRSLM